MDIELTLNTFQEARLSNAIHVVRGGQEALDYLLGRAPYQDRQTYPRPHLLLLDLNLPGIDGLEVLRQIRTTAELQRLPVVLLASSREEAELAMREVYRADRYLLKPVSFHDFLEVVQSIDTYSLTLNVQSDL